MIHEDAVLKKHPQANEFRPVKALLGSFLYGWTFEVPGRDGYLKKYGWVTCGGEVSSDTLWQRARAEKNLKTYINSQPGPNLL